MKQVAGRIKLELAQYREMAAFLAVRLGSRRLDATPAGARRAADRIAEAAAILADAGRGAGGCRSLPAPAAISTQIEVGDVARFETAMLGELRAKHPELLEAIRTEQGESPRRSKKRSFEFLDGFLKTFA